MANANVLSTLLPLDPYKVSDFTLYTEQDSPAGEMITQQLLPQGTNTASYSDPICLQHEMDQPEEFRSLICSCFRGEQYSITLRRTGNGSGREYKKPVVRYNATKDTASEYDPLQADRKVPVSERPQFLFTWPNYNDVLYRTTLLATQDKGGLVVIAGSTSIGKSNLIRGLIHSYLTGLVLKKSRSPHLVTFEDPIETLFYPDPETSQKCGFDYTPREKNIDVSGLREALHDCLRQTPSAVYVGETRNLSDWKQLVDFAGTGHLVFTTCHAGSLTEVISTLCKAVKADTAATRSSLATRLLAAIHLRPAKAKAGEKATEPAEKAAIVPALWRRTSAGINAMTSDGLSAILPNFFGEDHSGDNSYCFGRTYFAEQLLREITSTEPSKYGDSLLSNAVRFDLEGL
ncbi:MAG: ATPase, T2SS/T4P/T4SS family [Candidatus Angelobacter sp.]